MADRLVEIRMTGSEAAVEEVARQLRRVLDVARESGDHPNRRDPGVRRYLSVLLPEREAER